METEQQNQNEIEMGSPEPNQLQGAGDATVDSEMDNTNEPRTMHEVEQIPAEMRPHLDFIDIKKDGQLILGASSLTSRYWLGDLWLFANAEDAPDPSKMIAARQLDSGVPCGRFIAGLGVRAVVGMDGGEVEVVGWERRDDGESGPEDQLLVTHGRSSRHDGAVLCLDLLPAGADPDVDAARAVTGFADGSVKVWDLETLVSDVAYPGAHTHWVTGVCAHPAHPHQLVSCSLDGEILMWDTRAVRPARRLARAAVAGDRPTCCAWCPSDATSVAVGWESGRLSLLNAVSGAETAAAERARPLHRLRWHPCRPWLAACGDQTSVQVFTAAGSALDSRHEDTLHTDMARDLAWLPDTDTLFSCGWDRQVLSRTIS